MGKITEGIKKAWKYFQGKKRNIGTVIYLAGLGLEAFFPNLMPTSQAAFIQVVGASIAGIGMMDSLARSKTGEALLTKIKPKKR